MRNSEKTLVILDAQAIIHRAYHALPEFSTSAGEPTGALFGLSSMLLKILQDLNPDYIVACYDLPEPTFRHEVYEKYKIGRPKAEEDLVQQIERSRDLFNAFSIQTYEKAGFEADDLIGAIVAQVRSKKDLDVVIASGDMDTLQLVDGTRVTVYTLRKGIKDTIVYNEDAVLERFGFKPKLLPDFKGLRGDPSDNIIGIRGIGEKTATTLITEFGTIENIYKELRKDTKAFSQKGISDRILRLLEEGEEEALFSKELATINQKAPITFELPKKTWRESVQPGNIIALFRELHFRALTDRAKAFFDVREEIQIEEEKVDEKSREFKEAQVMFWLLDSEITNPTTEDILHAAKKHSLSEARNVLVKRIRDEGLEQVFEEIEKPLIPVIEQMEQRGILIDTAYLTKLSKDYHKELDHRAKKIFKHAGEEFNINSPRQLANILFEKLNLSIKSHKKTGTGLKSTRESELEKLKDEHPIVSEILSYRELQKLLSTYIDTIPGMIADDGRLHTTFLQTGTTTGRISSQNPNLQNIPIKSDRGRAIRRAFIAGDGFKLLSFDYSQIELRLAAVLSGDKKLTSIFKKGGDVHAETAALVFTVPPEMVDHTMRRQAKVINFGILYGMGVNALRANLGTGRAEAQQFLNEYLKNFSGLARYIEWVKGEAARKKYTTTLFGRRRYFEGINSPIPYIRSAAERMAVNAPMQGTQADIIKKAMVEIDDYIAKKAYHDDVHLILQIHDELVYEVKKHLVGEIDKKIKQIMEGILSLEETKGVPLVVEASVGDTWEEMKRL